MPILAIFHSPAQGSAWNLSNTGPEASEEKPFEIINIFSIQMYGAHTNAYRSKLDLAVKRLNVNVWQLIKQLLDRLFQMIYMYAKIQPQAILGFRE